MDGSRTHIEPDVVERLDARKRFGQIPDLKHATWFGG
jgi:hypothetical protein